MKKRLNLTSDVCPLCQGHGSYIKMSDGRDVGVICECRIREIGTQKLKFANIPEEFRSIKVNDYKYSFYQEVEAQAIAKSAKLTVFNYISSFERFQAIGKGLYFYSLEKGSGKTMLAAALANALVSIYRVDARFITTIDLLSEIKKTYSKDSTLCESEILNAISKVAVLILDDIGTEKQSDWVNETLYNILNARMTGKLITIFTSNIHNTKLKHDDRIKSRIEKMAIPVQMPEESIRKQQASKENEELMKELLGMG